MFVCFVANVNSWEKPSDVFLDHLRTHIVTFERSIPLDKMKSISSIVILLALFFGAVCADYPTHPVETCEESLEDLNPYSVFATAIPNMEDCITSFLKQKWTQRKSAASAEDKKPSRPAFVRITSRPFFKSNPSSWRREFRRRFNFPLIVHFQDPHAHNQSIVIP